MTKFLSVISVNFRVIQQCILLIDFNQRCSSVWTMDLFDKKTTIKRGGCPVLFMGVVKISQWRKEWVGRVACDSGVMKMVKKIIILSYFVHFFFFFFLADHQKV